MGNNSKTIGIVKWTGIALVLMAAMLQKRDQFGALYIVVGLVGFGLLFAFSVLNLTTYLKITRGTGTRRKGAVAYFAAQLVLFGAFVVFCVRRCLEEM